MSANSVWEHIIVKNTKQELVTELNQESTKEKEKPVYYKFDLSKDLLNTIDSMFFEPWIEQVVTRYFDELKDTPLFMKWTKRHLGEFLWYTQYDSILKKHNWDTLNVKAINDLDNVSFPLIYNDLNSKLPIDLQQILAQDKFEKYRKDLDGVNNLIITTCLHDGKYVIGYYVDSKLFLASYSSIGIWRSTPQWLFEVKRKIFDKRSFKYENAPMPYSLHLEWNIFIHQWYSDWTKRSKWCIRVPWLYQEILYYHSKVWTKVLIQF